MEAGGSDGEPIYQPDDTPLSNRLGVETVDPPYFDTTTVSACPAFEFCGYSDAAFIRYDDGVMRSLGRIARVPLGSIGAISHTAPPFRITAMGLAPEVGTTVHKIGKSLGHSQGTLINNCMDVSTGSAMLLCQAIARNDEFGTGDSGAPVFQITNRPEAGDVTLQGILNGARSLTSYVFG